jgi:glyoxylase-like metal-dependent hydrolase (beta-lactamase superfamily II)
MASPMPRLAPEMNSVLSASGARPGDDSPARYGMTASGYTPVVPASTATAAPARTFAARPRLLQLAAAEPEPIAEGVHLIRGGLTRVMNVFLIEDGDGVVVYDAGEKGMALPILRAAARMGGINRVVLGHGDTDHRGSAPALGEVAPVQCHPAAVDQAQDSGGRDYWDLSKLPLPARLLHRFTHRYVWDGGPVRISDTVSEGDEVAGFEVIDLSGHAPGLIGLWRAADRLALVSDCFYITDMYGREIPPSVPHEAYNLDAAGARAAIRKLGELDPVTCAPGHRGPLSGPDLRDQLERAAAA